MTKKEVVDKLRPDVCPGCGTRGSFQLVERDTERVVRNGLTFPVNGLRWYECSSCGEVMTTPAIMDLNTEVIDRAYTNARDQHRAKNNVLSPTDVKAIRSLLNETQASMSELFGIGANGFYKYEAEKSVPSKPVDLLLRLLAFRPELLNVCKALSVVPAGDFLKTCQHRHAANETFAYHVFNATSCSSFHHGSQVLSFPHVIDISGPYVIGTSGVASLVLHALHQFPEVQVTSTSTGTSKDFLVDDVKRQTESLFERLTSKAPIVVESENRDARKH